MLLSFFLSIFVTLAYLYGIIFVLAPFFHLSYMYCPLSSFCLFGFNFLCHILSYIYAKNFKKIICNTYYSHHSSQKCVNLHPLSILIVDHILIFNCRSSYILVVFKLLHYCYIFDQKIQVFS